MSSRERLIVLTSRASDNLEDILLYGLAASGFEATAGYRERIDDAIELIARFPDVGRPVTIAGVSVRQFPVGQHRILYRVDAATLTVSRLVHRRARLPGSVSSGP